MISCYLRERYLALKKYFNMKYQDKITVAVAIYNTHKFLHRCIASLLGQTYDNLEIILVDDGSTDGSGRICDEYALIDRRIKVIHQENMGLSAVRNAGIENASGKYIIFTDSDDEMCEDMIEKLYLLLTKNEADYSECGFLRDDDDVKATSNEKQDIIILTDDKKYLRLFSHWLKTTVTWNKLFNMEFFKELRFKNGIYHEDEFIIHHILRQSNKIVITDEKLYKYHVNKESLTALKSMEKAYDACLAFIDRLNMFEELGKNDFAFKSYCRFFRVICNTKKCYQMFSDKDEWLKEIMKLDKEMREQYKDYHRKLKLIDKVKSALFDLRINIYLFVQSFHNS